MDTIKQGLDALGSNCHVCFLFYRAPPPYNAHDEPLPFSLSLSARTRTPPPPIRQDRNSIVAEVMPGSFAVLRRGRRSLLPFNLNSDFMGLCSPAAFSLSSPLSLVASHLGALPNIENTFIGTTV